MRLRKVKNALEKLRQNKTYFIDNPQEHIKEWEKVFGNSYPIHMEIGSEKGKYISKMTKKKPNINYINHEK